MGTTVDIKPLEGDDLMPAYQAAPAGIATAAVIVIQEIFGVNPGIRKKCDDLAAAGYIAIAPDLYWRIKRGMVFDPDSTLQFAEAMAVMQLFDQDKGVRDIEATVRHARVAIGTGTGRAKVGCVGYCLGGRLAFMTAARTDIDASVGYYGVGIDQLLGESHAIAHPVLLHVPVEDHYVDKDAQAAMHAGLDGHPKVTLHDYPGLDHGFAAELSERRDDAGAQLADRRTMAFFADHLG